MKHILASILFMCFFSSLFCSETLEVMKEQKVDKDQAKDILAVTKQYEVANNQTNSTPSLQTEKCEFPKINNLIELKIGYFRPDNETFRDIYSGGPIYEIEGTFQAYKNLYPWVSVEYFHQSGKTLNVRASTRIDLVFFEIGLKYMYPINKHSDSLYLGIGVLPSYVHIKNNSSFLVGSTGKWGAGGVFKGGFLFNCSELIFLDVFLGYKYLKISPYSSVSSDKRILFNKVDLSGLIIGAGVAFHF